MTRLAHADIQSAIGNELLRSLKMLTRQTGGDGGSGDGANPMHLQQRAHHRPLRALGRQLAVQLLPPPLQVSDRLLERFGGVGKLSRLLLQRGQRLRQPSAGGEQLLENGRDARV